MQSTKHNQSGGEISEQQYDALLATAVKECRREKLFPRDHRIFLAGLIVGLIAMRLVAYVG